MPKYVEFHMKGTYLEENLLQMWMQLEANPRTPRGVRVGRLCRMKAVCVRVTAVYGRVVMKLETEAA